MPELDVLLCVHYLPDAALRFLDRIAEELELPMKKIEVRDMDCVAFRPHLFARNRGTKKVPICHAFSIFFF